MADIRCPSCGKNNPDFLDHCQFCQSPLKPESMLRAGESPTKKNTGELEPILPDWLRDLHQQSNKSAEEHAAHEAARSNVQKDEPPDLLAGLASQAGADNDEIPDWLASINPASRAKPVESPSSETDPFATQDDRLSHMGQPEDQSKVQEDKDELSEWMSQASQQPSEPFLLEPGISQDDPDWISHLDASAGSLGESASPKEAEDLSWLHDLEDSAKQSSETLTPQQDLGWTPDRASSQPPSGEEDLSWLNTLGGISEPSEPFDAASPFSTPTQGKPAAAEPSTPQGDLSWLDNLGRTEPLQPPEPSAAKEDLSWLDNLGRTSELSQPESAKPSPQEGLSSLKDLGETSDTSSPVLSPRQTAPLSDETQDESVPDWLKNATEEPSMPPLGAGALDWFASHNLDEIQPAPTQEASSGEIPAFTPSGESSPASNQDVDSLFSIDVPDWLSNSEPSASSASLQEAETSPAIDAESLSPVDLPSWVQAMRPVEAVISDTAPSTEDQAPEREGPLAGLRGVIPLLPIGSSRRPKALSLTLQTTDEQQAGAALLEEILASETAPRPPIASSAITSQNVLRWILTGLVLLVLGAMIGLRSQSMPVSNALPVDVSAASNAIANIPDGAPVLVVVDYEPALAGEMEAVSGPFLNNVVLLRHPNLSFLSTSPNGFALVERLMINTRISRPDPEGLGYQSGEEYFNLGYLPGGSAGVLAFIESPQTALSAADFEIVGIENFSQYTAVIVLTDHAESARVWVEQVDARKQSNVGLASQPLLIVASAQAGPLLQPYVSSRQVTGMISGLPDAARYEFVNNVPPGIARTYWDAFGIGLLLAIILITFGSLWSLFMGIRPRRSGAE